MKSAATLIALSMVCLGVGVGARVDQTQDAPPTVFVGTTPCDAVRTFLGGMERSAGCHSVTWKLVLNAARSGPSTWSATGAYGIPSPADPNQVIDGPRVSVKCAYQIAAAGRGAAKTVYRLLLDG